MSTNSADPSAPLLGLLDDVATLVSGARAMPMSASVMVNRAEVLDLVAAARDAVPDQVAAADQIVTDAEAVLSRAKDEAAQLVAKARAEAEELVSEHEITQGAHARAAEIEAAAQARVVELEAGADSYCDARLAQFEVDIDAVKQQVLAGRARLAARQGGRREQG
ncbi:hypothetical protein [Litorihabitans aurantiacus]|uniref:ATPase n=1 Tax=Litorihabitans aurantiacus TaxID=1930061 RepID=A0AA37UPT5_9MICO|nr:hypothetical protein [Litorihabitans aurantiacus]GMA30851.1 hypothetical protein GCM10025875_08430 [Litorihabitans aurantiacus]